MDMHLLLHLLEEILRKHEETLHAFIKKQEIINTQLAQSMTDFKDTLAKFTSAFNF
jgi:hypothetical protein